jgi:hypothetical protein
MMIAVRKAGCSGPPAHHQPSLLKLTRIAGMLSAAGFLLPACPYFYDFLRGSLWQSACMTVASVFTQ